MLSHPCCAALDAVRCQRGEDLGARRASYGDRHRPTPPILAGELAPYRLIRASSCSPVGGGDAVVHHGSLCVTQARWRRDR